MKTRAQVEIDIRNLYTDYCLAQAIGEEAEVRLALEAEHAAEQVLREICQEEAMLIGPDVDAVLNRLQPKHSFWDD